MDTEQKSNLVVLVQKLDELRAKDSEDTVVQGTDKILAFLKSLDYSLDPRETVAEAVIGLAQLIYALTEVADVFGVGLLDNAPFLKLAQNLLLASALSIRDLLPEVPTAE